MTNDSLVTVYRELESSVPRQSLQYLVLRARPEEGWLPLRANDGSLEGLVVGLVQPLVDGLRRAVDRRCAVGSLAEFLVPDGRIVVL